MKILSFKDVNVDFSEEFVKATKILGNNFWYRERVDKVAALNIWAKTFNEEMGFSIPIKFELEGTEESDCNEECDGDYCHKVFIREEGKVSLVTSIFKAVTEGIKANVLILDENILDNATAEVLYDLDMYCYIGFTASSYALNIYRICFPDKYNKAIDPSVKNIKLLIR